MLSVQSFTFNPVQENTYVVYNEEGDACIIDPGCYFAAEEKTLHDFIEAKKLTPRLLLNTHCHLDHVFGNRYVHGAWGLPLHLHRLEQQVLDRGPESGERWGLPFENYSGPLVYLEEGDSIRLGGESLLVLFTPGHSPGHVCFYSEAHQFLIGGDVLFQGSIGRTDLPGGNFATLEKSIREQLYTLPDAVVVHPGHGPATNIGTEKRSNPFVKSYT